jgi:hypothetical protein
MILSAELHPARPAQGRSCGTCALCCKVYDVPAIPKLMGKWCPHCTPGRGCGIHDTRPDHCRAFHCLWMTENWLGDEWKPEKSKMVLTFDPQTHFLFIQLDPGHPSSWRQEPYHAQLKRWAAAALQQNRHVIVFLNRHATIILPDREVALGQIGPEQLIIARKIMVQGQEKLDFEVISA